MANVRHESIEVLRTLEGPVVDVRSPSEFAKGHWPGACNIPLFSDEERAEVGTTYKQQGRLQAIQLGLSFTGPKLAMLSTMLQDLEPPTPTDLLLAGRAALREHGQLADLLDLSPGGSGRWIQGLQWPGPSDSSNNPGRFV